MPGFNPERVNIKDLSIEEPEMQAERLFDPERDISAEDWEKIEEKIKRESDPNRFSNNYEHAETLALANILGRKTEISQKDWERMEHQRNFYHESNFSVFVGYSFYEAILGRIPVLSESDWKKIQDEREDALEGENYRLFLSRSAEQAILGRKPSITPEVWQKIAERREISRSPTYIEAYDKDGFGLAGDDTNEAILGRKPEITTEEWARLKEGTKQIRDKNALMFARRLFSMSVLAADEIKIPEGGGIELINHKESGLQPEAPSIPEQRQF